MHQRQHGFAEEFKIGREVEESDLDPVATCALQTDELVQNSFRAADDLNVAAKCAVRVAMRFPSNRVT